ncbi:biotin synthase [Anaerobacterium chartisolvens]|uniref:Biotin synthase n=1 Tax=Anaerobacterium chartisolvens TaxID=1297424 RepID=A0A369BCQ4_9FIRM|nr:biotin synthase BioB [Anaerobacterium chartisolvens]RCX18378.1 biotin synthase [Anaerobacterium chartisolvens]
MLNFINELKAKVLQGNSIDFDEALKLINIDENDADTLSVLFESSNEIRKKFAGNKVDLCTIMNVKSGKCSENCKYCAQSAHYTTGAEEFELVSYENVLKRALEVQSQGAHRFSMVTSGRGIKSKELLDKLTSIYQRLRKDTSLKICASHGIISYEQAKQLKEAGVSMYHHNIETSSSHYPNICTTHDYEDRINTIRNVQEAGMEICCGGIIGMGETLEERIKMFFEIRELGVKSIPINVLNPIKGTPLEALPILSPMEILKTMAVARFIIPDSYIRYAGGRIALKDKQGIGFKAGVNAALVGNYLTTSGSNVEEDKQMIICSGLEI